MYEWENEIINKQAIQSEIHRLRVEIKRISQITLRSNFTKDEDREYWLNKLTAMNSKLSAMESNFN